MQNTPKGLRVHIGIYGRRNVGKSSFLNAVTGQDVSIVSEVAGTTTDPVEKAMELLPIGPVLFLDTPGIDDVGALGGLRVERTHKIMERTDVAVIVTEAGAWGEFEHKLSDGFERAGVPVIVVFNKTDLAEPDPSLCGELTRRNIPQMRTVARDRQGTDEFRKVLAALLGDDAGASGTVVGDLVRPGDVVVMVVPIDLEAPKGRLILPQVQTLRDILDHDAMSLVVKERELRAALESLNRPPALVVTDSQAFLKVAADVPDTVPMTSFSILFARLKGDLAAFVQGALAIERLKSGDRVLVSEACTHHPIGEDIGKVKIPRWLRQHVGGELEFVFVRGHDFPEDVSPYKLVVHCGSCSFNRRELLFRVRRCRNAGVPITNYGVCIANTLGILDRALSPFPGLLESARQADPVPRARS